MNHLPDDKQLLQDVLAENQAGAFRENLLGEILRAAQGRRRRRQVRRLAGAAGLVALVAGLMFSYYPHPASKPPAFAATGYDLVHSQPLPAKMIVTTQPLPLALQVVSVATANIVSTTATSGAVREINDGELLELSPVPAVLVWHAPHRAELVMARSLDQEP